MSLLVDESDFIFCDIQEVARYVRSRNPDVAIWFVLAVKNTVEMLAHSPHMGRSRHDLGFPEVRSWRVNGFKNYLIFYKPTDDRLFLLRVLHGNRDLQTELER